MSEAGKKASAAQVLDEPVLAAGRRQTIVRLRVALLIAVLVPAAAFAALASFMFSQAFM